MSTAFRPLLFGVAITVAHLCGAQSPVVVTTTTTTTTTVVEALQGCLSDPPCHPVLRPVTSSWMLSGGSAHIVDTYLTPLKYKGWGAAIDYERLQAMKFDPLGWNQRLAVGLQFASTRNPARNADMYHLNLAASWGMQRRFRLPYGIGLGIGPEVRGDAGVVYNRRNGNNPASAKADITIGAQGSATWGFTLGHMPVTLRYQTSVPVTGIFFSPDYDELYYEIYLGNHHGLTHAAWWGDFFRWDNQLTADLDFSATRLRVGFRADVLSTRVSNITSRVVGYSFIIGVTTDWFSIPRRKGLPGKGFPVVYAY